MGPRKLQRLRPRWAATFPVTNPWPSRLCLPLGADSTPHPTPRFGSVSAFQTGRLVSRTTVDAERAEGACAPARSTSTQPPGCPRRAPILPGPPQCRPRPPPAGGGAAACRVHSLGRQSPAPRLSGTGVTRRPRLTPEDAQSDPFLGEECFIFSLSVGGRLSAAPAAQPARPRM